MNIQPLIQEEIAIVVAEKDLPPSLLSNIEAGFSSSFVKAEEWRKKAMVINVTDASQTGDMKLARTIRLELRTIRVEAEKNRRELKDDFLRCGRAVDGVNNLLLAAIVPLETHLEEQEKFGERLLEQQRQKLITERTEAVLPYIPEGQPLPALDVMSVEQFGAYLADVRLLHQTKIETARRMEEERLAREAAEAAERERVRAENERLKKEAAEREEALRKERAERETELRRTEAIRLAREREVKAEKEAIEAKAEAVNAKLQEEQAARAKAEKILADKKAAEEKLKKQQAEEAKKAARAPDKEKILAFARTVRRLEVPMASTIEGATALEQIAVKLQDFSKWCETQAEKL